MAKNDKLYAFEVKYIERVWAQSEEDARRQVSNLHPDAAANPVLTDVTDYE